MATVTASFPLVGNLVGLPNGWARGLGVAGAATYTDDLCGPIGLGTGSFVRLAGTVILYVVTAEQSNNFTDGINPSAASDQSALIGVGTQANLVQQIGQVNPLRANTTYAFGGFSIRALLGYAPTYWSPLVWNLSGGPLSVTVSPVAVHTLQT